jgi:hypothetical protein
MGPVLSKNVGTRSYVKEVEVYQFTHVQHKPHAPEFYRRML